MPENTLKFWVDVAQLFSTIFAGIGLIVASWSFRQQTKATDISTLSSFFDRSMDLEDDLHRAIHDREAFCRGFTSYINHLEVMAFCVNKNLYGPRPTKFVRNKLIEDLAILDSIPNARHLVEAAIDAPNTFADLHYFICRNRRDFDTAKLRRNANMNRTDQ